ncbi:hypothetical protein R70723_20270 [Paenibacillus sp. FSL R7-0273]|uniref:hypothetical protein n=1 Tax=Paenibacillus sp. FSL R7-0273 TaxID=1536772 RepID=UPI0004F870BA|nr:hypothetical protein [Paenibacillus sp. FSL R7-0273]AIQ47980.1 hypothetical protein R70723_20270 [Paenibacillus sp. FSL R7-0273]OMF94470.1 hypothetical protein BK144_08030 [Paenibacillus sp. FSL R7-0273]
MRKISLFVLSACAAAAYLILAGCSSEVTMPSEPIKPEVRIQKEQVSLVSGESCWALTEKEGLCSDPPHPDTFYKTVKEGAVTAGGGKKLTFDYPLKPEAFYLTRIDPDGTAESVGKPDQYSYRLPGEPGEYIYKLSAVWDERRSAAVYFAVVIK